MKIDYHVKDPAVELLLVPYTLSPNPQGVFRYEIKQTDGSAVANPFAVEDI